MKPGRLILITGIMAAGKSTVAELVAQHLNKSIHLRGDIFRKMIVSGRVDMSSDASEEALDQLMLRYRTSALVAERYAAAGFDVVFQDVILGRMLEAVIGMFGDTEPNVIVLNPSAEVVEAREHSRPKTGYTSFSVRDLMKVLDETPKIGTWIDSSDQTPKETAEQILSLISWQS